MSQHFEQIWEKAEALMSSDAGHRPVSSIISELTAKLSLYQALDANDKIPVTEKSGLKSHLFGKLLLSIAQLSLKDNINVFTALNAVLEEERVSQIITALR